MKTDKTINQILCALMAAVFLIGLWAAINSHNAQAQPAPRNRGVQWQQADDRTTSDTPGTVTHLAATNTIGRGVIIFADASNTGTVSIGPTTNATLYPLAAGQWFTIPTVGSTSADGGAVDIYDWYAKSSEASQTYRVLYY